MLHFIAGKRLARGPADRGRRDQRAARGAQAAGRAGARVPLPAGRHRAQPAGEALPGAQRSAAGSRLRPARRPQPAVSSCGARCAASSAKASATSSCWSRRKRSTPAIIERAPLWNDKTRRARARSTSSAMCTAASTNWATLLAQAGLRDVADGVTAARPRRHAADGRKAIFVGDLVDRGPRRSRRAAPGDGHGRARARRSACPATTT